MYSLNSKYSSKVICVDSSKASQYILKGNTSAFVYEVEDIKCENAVSMVVSINQVIIPHSFYSCEVYCNAIDVKEYRDKDDEKDVHFINERIPRGNYSAFQLATVVENILNSKTAYGIQYFVVYDKITNRFNLSINSNNENAASIFQFITGLNKAQSCKKLLGFQNDITIKVREAFESDIAVNLNEPYLYIKSDILSNSYIVPDGTDSIVTVIPVNTVPNSVIYYSNPQPPRFLIFNRRIERFKVSLTTRDNNTIDLNGLHWSFLIQIDYIRNDANGITSNNPNLRETADIEFMMRFNVEHNVGPEPNDLSLQSKEAIYRESMYKNLLAYLVSKQTKI